MCSEARWLTPSDLEYAAQRGVQLVPWVLNDTDPEHLRPLVEHGVKGLIVPRETAFVQ